MSTAQQDQQHCDEFFADRSLIIAANRGPVMFQTAEDGSRTFTRGSGGLVTALVGLARRVGATWIGCARTDEDVNWEKGELALWKGRETIGVHLLSPDPAAYEAYYNVIANPLLWFLQHSMWDIPRKPVIDRSTWAAWQEGYVAVNQLFAAAIINQCRTAEKPPLVMLHDYHLYLTPRLVRSQMRPSERPTLTHFVHIPWPGPDYWSILPARMRQAILEGLLGVDLLGFQTNDDVLNFIRTCQQYLSRVGARYKIKRVWYRNHATHVRAFPISIDVQGLRRVARSTEVGRLRDEIEEMVGERQLILRIERIEPSKNIIRGFQAYDEMLTLHPELQEKVLFLAILVPSRLDLGEYRDYLDEVMAAVGHINAAYATGTWEPVRVLVGEKYERAVAAMQRYDVLLVNSIADGMNLVAKEGPIVNKRHGQLVLSERTGAREQLEAAALVIAPCDISATANALHQALIMPAAKRRARARELRAIVEESDVYWWLCQQIEAVERLGL
ncbi:MAG: trehalose-6-phosphate synthase [Candidatus Promineifilaceae bacterium]|nr:trehalose-6-phosphate synthase [Candidatus Promineifilaceae bacterium]